MTVTKPVAGLLDRLDVYMFEMIAHDIAPEDPVWAVQLMLLGFNPRGRIPKTPLPGTFNYKLLRTRWVRLSSVSVAPPKQG